MTFLLTLINAALTALLLAIFLRAILSWFPVGANNPIFTMVIQITEPILQPIRRVLPRTGGLDLSPMVAILVILLIRSLLAGV